MKVYSLGSLNIDYTYSVDNFVKGGETISASSMQKNIGGKGLNQSLAMARAGLSVCHAGAIGQDGLFLSDMLRDSGVDVSFLSVREDLPTGHAVIQVSPEGQNSIIVYGGANATISEREIEHVLSHFSEGDIIVLQNEIAHIEYIIERAAARGMRIFFNPSPFNASLLSLPFDKMDTLIINEVEGAAISGEKAPPLIAAYFKKNYPKLHVILTLGAEGSVYIDAEHEVYCPAFKVDAVDTTSAGDTFTGYYISATVRGKSIEGALRLASAASALGVSRHGAAVSIPYADEVKRALGSLCEGHSPIGSAKRQAVIEYIESHPADVSLSDIADLLGYSESHTTVWFRRELGTSFTDLLMETRCRIAATLLAEGEKSAREIVSLCGYENGGFFRKKFKERYGMTPLAYRKEKGGLKK